MHLAILLLCCTGVWSSRVFGKMVGIVIWALIGIIEIWVVFSGRLSGIEAVGILLLALFCDLSFLIFASGKELGKKQMAVRFCIHIPLEVAIVLFFASKWDWVNIDKPLEVAVFVLLILGVYAAVLAVAYYQDKKTADKLNDSLRKRYHS